MTPLKLAAGQVYISASSGKEITIIKVTLKNVSIQRHNGRDTVPFQTALYNIQNKLWLTK